jgi:hypothetical protein
VILVFTTKGTQEPKFLTLMSCSNCSLVNLSLFLSKRYLLFFCPANFARLCVVFDEAKLHIFSWKLAIIKQEQ